MRKSEIFESFVKIAQKNGLVSNADHAKHTEKDFSETNPRMDSLSIEQISKLYNTKPELPEDMKYKKNIMEDAHPKPVVISPSHDKLNGLVESEVEGQNIRIRIVRKEPDGHLTQRKYAEKQLLLSLVRVANDLDNNNKDELRKLADFCLLQVDQSTIKKQAQVVPIIAGVVALLGGIYLKNHMRFISDGLQQDQQKLINEIDDLINSNDSTQTALGAGYTYKPELISMMQDLKSKVTSYFQLYSQVQPLIENLEKPRTAKELIQLAAQPETKDVLQAYQSFRAATDDLLPYIQQIETNFANEGFKSDMIQEKGMFMSMIDAPQIFHGGKGFIADDFDDVRHALETYVYDIQNVMKILKTSESLQQDAKNKIMAAKYESQKDFGPETQSPTTPIPLATPHAQSGEGMLASTEQSAPWGDLEKELAGGLV